MSNIKFEEVFSGTKTDCDLTDFNAWLYTAWLHLPLEIRNLLAYPYLVTPTEECLNSQIKFLVMNRETNSWGKKEQCEDGVDLLPMERVKKIYTERINKNWDNLGSVWPMYYALRMVSEGLNPDIRLKGKIGFIHSNVALIGKKDGNGFESDIRPLLVEAIDKQIKSIAPNVILLGIGFGTESGKQQQYLDILSETFLGTLTDIHPCNGCESLYKLKFAHQDDLIIFGCRHPQGLNYKPIANWLKDYLLGEYC